MRHECYNFGTMVAKTDTTMYKGHREWYIAGFIVSLLALIWMSIIAHRHSITGWEKSLFFKVNDWPDSLKGFFKAASIAKESLVIGAVAVVVTFALKMWRLSWRLAASLFAGFAVGGIMKHEIGRARPVELLHNVHVRWADSGNGFPSGHALVITIVMLTILPYVPRKWSWIIPIPIILVMLSRVYLGLHAPLDVIGGFAVGVLVVSAVRIMPQAMRVFLRLD